MQIKMEQVSLDTILTLRHEWLRPDVDDPKKLISDADIDPDALHLAAKADGQTVGILSAGAEVCPFRSIDHSWRIRGIAVSEAVRKRGIGLMLLKTIIVESHSRGARALWGKTRVSALPVHIRAGFETIGEEYDIPPTGPHYTTFVQLTDEFVSSVRKSNPNLNVKYRDFADQ